MGKTTDKHSKEGKAESSHATTTVKVGKTNDKQSKEGNEESIHTTPAEKLQEEVQGVHCPIPIEV